MGTRFDDEGNAINPARAAGDWSAFYEAKASEYANTSRSEREVAEIELKMFEFIKSKLAKQGFSEKWTSDRGFYSPWSGVNPDNSEKSCRELYAVGFQWIPTGIQTKALDLGWNKEIICDENGRLI